MDPRPEPRYVTWIDSDGGRVRRYTIAFGDMAVSFSLVPWEMEHPELCAVTLAQRADRSLRVLWTAVQKRRPERYRLALARGWVPEEHTRRNPL